MSQRLRPLFLSLLFLLVSAGAFQSGTSYLDKLQDTTESPAGTWQQYVVADGRAVYLGTFHYQRNGDDYEIVPRDVAACTFPQTGYHTFDHQYDGNHWTFQSDWHEYGIAEFQLERVDQGRFEGYAYLDGEQRPYRHILVRVGD